MTQTDSDEFVRRAEEIDTSRLRGFLESEHIDDFVAIDPDSDDYFLGKILNDATRAVRIPYPNQLTYVMRIGHRAALHFGLRVR